MRLFCTSIANWLGYLKPNRNWYKYLVSQDQGPHISNITPGAADVGEKVMVRLGPFSFKI